MKAQKKLLVTILALPMAYADLSLQGTINYLSDIGTISSASSFFNETDGFTTDNDIVIPITHNGDTGWTLSIRAENGGAFSSEAAALGSGDGYDIAFTIGNCTLSNSDHSGTETLTTDAIHLHVGFTSIASVSAPMQATSADLTCYLELADGASIDNLLSDGANEAAYTFSETLYISLSPYTS